MTERKTWRTIETNKERRWGRFKAKDLKGCQRERERGRKKKKIERYREAGRQTDRKR